MAKKFKAKKRVKISNFIKIVFLIIIILYIIKHIKIFNFSLVNPNSSDKYVKYILEDNNHYSYPNKRNSNIVSDFLLYLKNNFVKNPKEILKSTFNYKTKINNQKQELVIEEINENMPSVYIYNSHQSENYSMEYLEDYNIIPNVLMVSYIIKEKLSDYGISTIVEDGDISSYLQNNNMEYYQSYEASRYYLKRAMDKYDNILLYLDVHRDAIDHGNSTTEIDGVNCAKIMFVVGLEHDNYQDNLNNANHLNDMIKNKYPTLTRGVLQKEGKNVNGIYNQDLSPDIMLMEIGGNYNNISEVLNTVDLITPIIGEYINEKKQEIK